MTRPPKKKAKTKKKVGRTRDTRRAVDHELFVTRRELRLIVRMVLGFISVHQERSAETRADLLDALRAIPLHLPPHSRPRSKQG